ncbi:hypothetical protein KPK_B0005 (plasmid) [Klebsiella variicola]|uniref:Uncharacterized protein n=1 Tax=Klebsiella variicola (strain 342) TaxID=507522 RepID=B5RKG6_KLEV3|nr:hypothetical protein KPK_B0005 [Klebsiella variicola]
MADQLLRQRAYWIMDYGWSHKRSFRSGIMLMPLQFSLFTFRLPGLR